MIRVFLLTILLVSGMLAHCQDYKIEQLTMEDGLPSNRVYSVFKDSRGFIWFCTDNGVCRYNGINLETFSMADGLADSDIFNCFEDKWGRIWFASYNGKLSFFENEKFYNQKNCAWLKNNIHRGHIERFVQDVSDSSFYVIHILNELEVLKVKNTQLINKNINLGSFDTSGKSFQIPFYNGRQTVLGCAILNEIEADQTPDHNRYLWYLDNNENRLLCTTSFIRDTMERFMSRDNIHLINIEKSLLKLDGTLETLEDNLDNLIYAYYKRGNLTFLGEENGLKIKNGNKASRLFKNTRVSGIQADKNIIFVATNSQGVYLLIEQSSKKSKRVKQQTVEKINPFINKLNILSIHQWKNEKILLCKHTVRKLDQEQNLTMIKNMGTISLKTGILKDDYFVFNDPRSIQKVNLKNNTYHYIQGFNEEILQVTIDEEKQIFVVGNENFYSLDEQEEKITALPYLSKCRFRRVISLQGYFVGINEENKIIVATKGEKTALPESFLPNESFIALKKIDSFSFLATDSRKVNHLFQLKNGKLITKTLVPQFQSINLSDVINMDNSAIYTDTDGHSLLLNAIEITAKQTPPKLFHIISGRRITDNQTAQLKIDYKERYYIKMSYLVKAEYNQSLSYEYALVTNNRDTNWIRTSKPEVILTNTAWGKYCLLFRAYDQQYIYSNTLTTEVSIAPPFYLRWWFLILMISGIIVITYYYSLRKSRKENALAILEKENEKKFLQSEFKSLNALMNPHFVFNSLNSIQGIINSGNQKDANQYLEIFSKMMRQNMSNIEKIQISLEKEIALVKNYLHLEQLRFKDKISYSISIDPNVDPSEIYVPPLSLQPIVENSIRHGIFPILDRGGKINISIFELGEVTTIQVIDNGIGFSRSKKKTGNDFALTNIEKRFYQLSKILDKKITFQVQDLIVDGAISGTIAEIKIIE